MVRQAVGADRAARSMANTTGRFCRATSWTSWVVGRAGGRLNRWRRPASGLAGGPAAKVTACCSAMPTSCSGRELLGAPCWSFGIAGDDADEAGRGCHIAQPVAEDLRVGELATGAWRRRQDHRVRANLPTPW